MMDVILNFCFSTTKILTNKYRIWEFRYSITPLLVLIETVKGTFEGFLNDLYDPVDLLDPHDAEPLQVAGPGGALRHAACHHHVHATTLTQLHFIPTFII